MPHYEGTIQGVVTFFDTSSAQFRLQWTIPNYLKVQKRVKCGDYVELKQSVSVIPGKFNCVLRLYPNGTEESLSGDCSFFIFNGKKNDVWMDFQISLLDGEFKQQHVLKAFRRSIVKVDEGWGFEGWFPTFPFDISENTLLPNGCLQILVVGTVFTNKQVFPDSHVVQRGESARSDSTHVSFDVSFLHQSSEHSDAILSVDEEKFQVHKCILSNRSSVFKDLFKNESQNILVIPDISPDVFRQVLQFIYTDSVTAAIDTMLPEVIKAADTYKLDYLKDICQIKMYRNIFVSNAVNYLRVAEETNAYEIKEKAMDFIIKNKSEVSKEGSWQVFKSENSYLLVELLDRFML